MKPIRIGIAIALMLAAMADFNAQDRKQQEAERQLKAAINTELVDRNPKAAIEQYKKVVASGIRPLAAQALIHMADCYRQLGDAEAQRIYQRILEDYKDQQDVAAEAQAQLERMGVGIASASSAPRTVTQLFPYSFRGSVSRDGRYLLQRSSLKLFDVVTRQERSISGEPQPNYAQLDFQTLLTLSHPEFAVLSPDGKHVAYTFLLYDKEKWLAELRTLPVNSAKGIQPRVLLHDQDLKFVVPLAFAPDAGFVYALLQHKDDTTEITAVRVSDGSRRRLKSLEWRWPNRLSVSPDGRYIVYDVLTIQGSQDRDIFMLSVDSGAEVRLVQHPAADSEPVWAPDGKAVVFVSDRSGSDGLWMIRVEDGKPRESAELLKATATVSPIGFALNGALYYTVGGLIPPGVDTAELDLTRGTLVRGAAPVVARSTGSSYGPSYSPDGKNLAYFHGGDIETRSLESATRQFAAIMTVSPAGNSALSIVAAIDSLASRTAIVIRSLSTGEEREIPTDLPDSRSNGPAWFPDGQSLALIANQRLHRIDLSTGKDLIDGPVVARGGTSPSVSPDGKRVYYTRADDRGVFLMAYDLETRREIELFKGGLHPQANLPVSPDGRMIAFRTMDPHALRVISSSGGEARTLFTPSGEAFFPISWSPDGRSVLMSRGGGDTNGRELWWIPVDGGDARRIGTDVFPIFDSIHPDSRQVAIARRTTSIPGQTWVDPAIFIPVGQDRRIFEARILPDGSKVTGPIAVTRSVAVQDRQPMWSPDGKSIVFKRGRTEGNLDLVVRSMETSQERTYPITIGRMGNERPHWFHDGKSISVGVAGQDAYRFDVASGRLQKFDGFGLGPHDISLDGKTIYSLGRNSMDQMSVAGFDIATGQRKETLVQGFLNRSPNAASPGGMAGILRVSPDGRLLATTTRDGGEWQVSIVALDGSSHRDIYKSSRIGMPNGGYTRLLAWTKDSRAILFGQFADGSRTDVQIMRIPVTGGKPQFTGLTLKGITQEDTIDISPDGSRILFSASAEGVSISKPR